MSVLPHISSVYANPWIGWVLVALLLFGLLGNGKWVMGNGLWQNLFSSAERTYTIYTRAWGSEVCACLFRIGVLAMAYWLLAMGNGEWIMDASLMDNGVWIMGYGKVFVAVLAVYGVRRLLLQGIGRVFISRKQLNVALEQYEGVCAVACVCLYPILLVLVNVVMPDLAQILCGGLLVAFVGMIVWKSIRLFYANLLSLLYILLYILFLEIVPIMVIFSIAKKIVSL